MTTAFQAAGAQGKSPKYAPILTRRFWTGLWTNRNPIGDPVTPYLYDRLYNASRYDFLIDGHDCEITPTLTLARRPGHSVYNSQSFPAINDFYEFKTFTTSSERIYVIADTAATVYDATGPSTKNSVFTKSGGAGQSFFKDVANVLYFGNGIDTKKWLPTINSFNTFAHLIKPRTWPTSGAVALGDLVIDTNSNVQIVITAGTTGGSQPSWNASPFGTTTDNTAVWRNHGPLVMKWGVDAPVAAPTILPPTSPNIFTVRFWVPSHSYGGGGSNVYSILDSNGNLQVLVDGTKTTGAFYPPWNVNLGGQTFDGTAVWVNHGELIAINDVWKNSFTFGPGSNVVDNNGNIQVTFGGGTTPGAGGQPAFSTTPGGTTADGTITWTCLGTSSVCAGGTQNTGGITITVVQGTGPAMTPGNITNVSNTANNPSTTLAPRGYVYYTAFFTVSGHFSNLSPGTLPTGPVFGQTYSALISGVGSADSQVSHTVTFRTVDGGVTAFAKISDNSAIENSGSGAWGSITDTTIDNNLDKTIIGEALLRNSPPPVGLVNLDFHLGRIWGSAGNVVYFSNPAFLTIGIGWEGWPGLNVYTFPSLVMRLHPTAIGMLVITVSDTFIIPINQFTGLPSPSPFPYIPGVGISSPNAFAVNGSRMFVLTSSGNVLGLDPSSGIIYAGHPIADKLGAFSRTASYLAWHEEGEDVGLYVADGTSKRYRMAASSAPESGDPPWSPVCNLSCKAIKSVEVLPGVNKLLIGPATSGPILQRDVTANTDNGANFTVGWTIGTLMLASPGQLSEIKFISTLCRKVGSHPSVSVLLDEISGPFSALATYTQEPPVKFRSSTIMMDRFYMNQTNDPAKCMLLQLQVNFPAENAKNEMFAYSLYGAHWEEI